MKGLPRVLSGVFGGNHRITNSVDRLGVYGRYHVVLFARNGFFPVRSVFSDTDGTYLFNHLQYIANGYFAVAFDHSGSPLNAAIADLITPEPMP